MTHRILSVPAWPGCRALATLMLATAFIMAAGTADAQTPQPQQPQQPKAQPKKAQPKQKDARPAQAQPAQLAPAPQAGPTPQMPQLIYSQWTKVCQKPPDANAKQVCVMHKEGRIESGMPIVGAFLIEPDGVPKKILRVQLPPGVLLRTGTRVLIDQNEQLAATAPFVVCFPNGCLADYEVNTDIVGRLKKGQNLFVQAYNLNGMPMTLALPLGEFAKAYDGPPTDPKVVEEQQRKLQEELQERARKARERLEQQGQQGKTN